MWPAVLWLGAGLALALAEALSGDLVLLMLAGGALAAGGASLLGVDPLWSAVVFALVSGLLVFAVRPPLRRRLARSVDASVMHSDALVGGPAVVVARVDGDSGRIKIGGDVWSARSYGEVLEEGTTVTVVEIKGATAYVVGQT